MVKMNKQETLNYLQERKTILAPVYEVESIYSGKEYKLDKRTDSIGQMTAYIIIAGLGAILLNIIMLFSGVITYSFIILGLVLLGVGIVFNFGCHLLFCSKLENEVNGLKARYQELTSTRLYREKLAGFPQEFYNYIAVYKLFRLIDENRALTLQEAYNTLERQNFYEDQAAHNYMMAEYQKDIANYTQLAAINSEINADNSRRIYNKVNE